MKVAIDVDSTLAASPLAVFEEIEGRGHGYSLDDIEYWNWGFDEFSKDEYLGAFETVWSERPLSVPPMEHHLSLSVGDIFEDHTVDIVTAKPDTKSVIEGKKEWLYDQGIPYDNFIEVPRDKPKTELGYDVYVDDHPKLPKHRSHGQKICLVDQPYNWGVEGAYLRVTGLYDAAQHIDDLASMERPKPQ